MSNQAKKDCKTLIAVIISAFVYALSIFYLPNYQCVQLAYFDAAKEDMPEFRSRQSDFSDGPGSF